jgi:crotonobetainyl-CoA:carnitine CoA-transferase CaiB-like acyl-CoA transferase
VTSPVPSTLTPLAGVRVLEWSSSLAGAYAGRLLADVGAQVTRVGAMTSLGRGAEMDAYLHQGKGEAAFALSDLPFLAEFRCADVVLLELPDAPAGDLLSRFGDAVVVVITPWGLDGPWAGTGRPWSEFTLQLESGSLSLRGLSASYPLMTGSSESLWIAGTMAAGAAAAALQGAAGDRLVDVSLLEVTSYSTTLLQDVAAAVASAPKQPFSYRIRLSPSVEPAKDGWVGFNLASMQNHEDFLVLIERPDWLADEQMSSFLGRYQRMDEWNEAVRSWTLRHTVQEIVELASAFRIPCSPVHSGSSVLDDPQVVERDFYGQHPDGSFAVPKPPLLYDGFRPSRPTAPPSADGTKLAVPVGAPFEGLRVLDLGTWWVGAYVGSCLGSYGADVIKIESTRRIDGSRTLGGVPQTRDHWWECGNFYLGANFNKRNVTLDITQEEGRDLLVRLIETADVLIENYAPRVLESVGLDWDAVHALNPRLVMLRMPAFGLTGPRRAMVGYAQTVEQFSGLCWRTGYPGGDPTNPSGPADPMGGANSFFALAAALRHSRATGRGILVEAPLVEGALTMSSEQVIRWTSRGELLGCQGNRDEGSWFQGVFPTREQDVWVGLSVADEAQWFALLGAAGFVQWRDDPDLADADGVRDAAEDVEKAIGAWLAEESADEVVAKLLAVGVPAGRMADARFVHEHPQLASRFELTELPWAGTIGLPTLPYRRAASPQWLRRRPPTLGEHNEEILGGELGLSQEELGRLAELDVIGTRPVGAT